ncbi:hypothetical protein NDU88_005610 [Pleurodeles waltl]|uniref:Uncharacterized protein n=1 Tax=Pleurodeles waltl TaxID=8319 RepID=A0AAV7UIL8_PLEWA|nr:hypothetical protein NDU88_005610 [Pleurodeles waltl]
MSRCAKLLGDAVRANSTVPMKNYLWLDSVYEDTFSGAANILEADSASEDVMDNYDVPAQEVEESKDHPDNLGRNVTYRSRLGLTTANDAPELDIPQPIVNDLDSDTIQQPQGSEHILDQLFG